MMDPIEAKKEWDSLETVFDETSKSRDINVLSSLLKQLKEHANASNTVEKCLAELYQFCEQDQRNCSELVHAGGVARIVVSMRLHRKQEQVFRHGYQILQLLAETPEYRILLIKEGFVSLTIQALKEFGHLQDIAESALAGLQWSGTLYTPEASKWIPKIMTRHPTSSSIQRDGCFIFWNNSNMEKDNASENIVYFEELNAIVQAMENHKFNAAVMKYACGALQNYTQVEKNCRTLLQCSNLDSVLHHALSFGQAPSCADDAWDIKERVQMQKSSSCMESNEKMTNGIAPQSYNGLDATTLSKADLLAILQRNGLYLKEVNHELQDKEIVLAAVSRHGSALQYANPQFQNDKDIVLAAVARNSMALKYASKACRGNREIVLAAVSKGGPALQFAEEQIRNDKALALAAVSQNGLVLQHVMGEWRGDRKIVLAAVTQECRALRLASDACRNDEEIVMVAIMQRGLTLEFASDMLRDAQKVVLAAVRQNGLALQFASERLRDDINIVLAAVGETSAASRYASERCQVAADVVRNGWALKDASAIYQDDREIVSLAVKHNGMALQFVSERLRDDQEIVLAALAKDGGALKYASTRCQGDCGAALVAVTQDGLALQFVSKDLQNDTTVVLAAVTQNGMALRYATDSCKDSREIVLAAISQNGLALEFASEKCQDDVEIVMKAFNQVHISLNYASERWSDAIERWYLSTSMPLNTNTLRDSEENWRDDKEIVMMTVAQDGMALQFVSERCQDDKDVVLTAVQENGRALQFASNTLRESKEIVMIAARSHPPSLKFAYKNLQHDPDCLQAAGLLKKDHDRPVASDKVRVVLSTRFSLGAQTTTVATEFTLALLEDEYFGEDGDYKIYFPNAFAKSTCDQNWTHSDGPCWTNPEHPCRGTYETCQMPHDLKTGTPTDEWCWRRSFREKLIEAKQQKGYMIQVVEPAVREDSSAKGKKWSFLLGKGQWIELQMAQEIGVKVFQLCLPRMLLFHHTPKNYVSALQPEVTRWYENECQDLEIQVIDLKKSGRSPITEMGETLPMNAKENHS